MTPDPEVLPPLTIKDLDAWLLQVTGGLPREPARRYELHCHPDVIQALTAHYPPPSETLLAGGWVQVGRVGPFGSAAVIAEPDLGPGGWELHHGSEIVSSGRLRSADTNG